MLHAVPAFLGQHGGPSALLICDTCLAQEFPNLAFPAVEISLGRCWPGRPLRPIHLSIPAIRTDRASGACGEQDVYNSFCPRDSRAASLRFKLSIEERGGGGVGERGKTPARPEPTSGACQSRCLPSRPYSPLLSLLPLSQPLLAPRGKKPPTCS